MDTAVSDRITDWSLTAVGGLDYLLVGILLAIVFALSFWTWRSLDPEFPLKKRLAITLIRALILTMGVGLVLQPALNIRTFKREIGELAILVDVSGSMERGESSRLKRVEKLLATHKADIADLEKKQRIAWYQFADDLVSVSSAKEATRPPGKNAKTHIAKALDTLFENRKNELNGVVILSDGADTEIPFSANGNYDASWARKYELPINTVLIQDAMQRKDLAVVEAEMDAIAFSRSETPIAVTLRSVGLPDREVEVFLWQNGSVQQRKTVSLVGGKGRLTFAIFPSTLGHHVLTVTVPISDDDQVPENNKAHVAYEVIRDKFRILHVAGQPSWDQRFLRQTLKAWPRADLVSFYILRTTYQSENLGSAGIALIPFPTEDLFEGHLEEFDIIVFQGFEPAVVGVDRYLDDIAKFVEKGGAFVLLAGSEGLGIEKTFSKGFQKMLPVNLLKHSAQKSHLTEETPFRLRITDEGVDHPLMNLAESKDGNAKLWHSLLRLEGIARVASTADNAHRLAENPLVNADDGPQPVIAVKEHGSGRSLVIGTDSLWRWRFTSPMEGGPVDVYGSFWKQAVAWLTRSPELERLRVTLIPATVPIGTATQITIELMNRAYRPLPGTSISYDISWYDEDGAEKKETLSGVLDGSGRYTAEWKPQAEGPHVLTAKGDGITKTKRFLASSSQTEMKHLEPSPRLLKALSEATDGFAESGTLTPRSWVAQGESAHQILSHRDIQIWDHPLALLGLFALLATEWLLRRKIGLS